MTKKYYSKKNSPLIHLQVVLFEKEGCHFNIHKTIEKSAGDTRFWEGFKK